MAFQSNLHHLSPLSIPHRNSSKPVLQTVTSQATLPLPSPSPFSLENLPPAYSQCSSSTNLTLDDKKQQQEQQQYPRTPTNVQHIRPQLPQPPPKPLRPSQPSFSSPPPPPLPPSKQPIPPPTKRRLTVLLTALLSLRTISLILAPTALALANASALLTGADTLFLMGMLAVSATYSLSEVVVYLLQLARGKPYRRDYDFDEEEEEEEQSDEGRWWMGKRKGRHPAAAVGKGGKGAGPEAPWSHPRPNVRGGPFIDVVVGLAILIPVVIWLETVIGYRRGACFSPADSDDDDTFATRACRPDAYFPAAWILGVAVACLHLLLSAATMLMYLSFFAAARKRRSACVERIEDGEAWVPGEKK